MGASAGHCMKHVLLWQTASPSSYLLLVQSPCPILISVLLQIKGIFIRHFVQSVDWSVSVLDVQFAQYVLWIFSCENVISECLSIKQFFNKNVNTNISMYRIITVSYRFITFECPMNIFKNVILTSIRLFQGKLGQKT